MFCASPIPKLAGLAQVHGAKIGAEGVSALKEKLGFEDKPFAIDLEMVQQVFLGKEEERT